MIKNIYTGKGTNQPQPKSTIHPNKIPYTRPETANPHNKFVYELSKPHPQFEGVQKVQNCQMKYLLEKSEKNPQKLEGKYLKQIKYKFRPDVWELEGEILYKSPFEETKQPKNEFVKQIYEDRKEKIKQQKIMILELQKQAKLKRKQMDEEEERKRPKNNRKYSNDMEENEQKLLQQEIDKLQQDQSEYQQSDDEEENENDDQKSDNQNENENNNQDDDQEEDDDDEEEKEDCQEIKDFDDIDDDEEENKKQNDSFDDVDVSKSFVSQVSQNNNLGQSKYASDFANQLDNAFNEMVSSQSTDASKVIEKKRKKQQQL